MRVHGAPHTKAVSTHKHRIATLIAPAKAVTPIVALLIARNEASPVKGDGEGFAEPELVPFVRFPMVVLTLVRLPMPGVSGVYVGQIVWVKSPPLATAQRS